MAMLSKLNNKRFLDWTGVDFQDTAVRVVVLRCWRDRVQLRQAVELSLTPGMVVNRQVREPKKLAPMLKKLWRHYRLPSQRVVLGVDFKHVQSHRLALDINDVEPVTLEQEVLAELEMQQTHATEDLYVDFQLLPMVQDQNQVEKHQMK